ncbi:hypothetical protein ACN47E_008299 [Coniothyrium glycines]
MLTYPDRQRFEQIKARWETGIAGEEDPDEMVGRRVKQAAGQPDDSNGGSKFRRKLSHGLALISSPLLQRKVTPGRFQANIPALAVTAAGDASTSTVRLLDNPVPSPSSVPSPSATIRGVQSDVDPPPDGGINKAVDPDRTPRPLPRSRTLSFIPRPVRTASGSFSIHNDQVTSSGPPIVSSRTHDAMPSKIPSPSPPLCERRVITPRQYHPAHTPHNVEDAALVNTGAASKEDSPKRIAIRSRTTPNLMEQVSLSHLDRKSRFRRSGPPAASARPVLQENVPTNRQNLQRGFPSQQKDLRRESLAVPGVVHNRRSFGPGTLNYSKQSELTTPPSARKRLSAHLAQQTPVTAKRIQLNGDPTSFTARPCRGDDNTLVAVESYRKEPTRAPTPTPAVTSPTPLPPLSEITDSRRRTLGTPNGLAGMWRTSRALAAANHEVKDYMPALYWAGRFQSRFDQWRTEAMMAELQPEDSRPSGPLSECKLHQETTAACHIFGQLRELCISDQAADSLWEFEYRYRRDHKLLGTLLDLPEPPSRKQADDPTQQGAGAFVRAVRKLTPRKTSLVNLLKGKGRNKVEENKATQMSEYEADKSSMAF